MVLHQETGVSKETIPPTLHINSLKVQNNVKKIRILNGEEGRT